MSKGYENVRSFLEDVDLLRSRFTNPDLRIGRTYPELTTHGLATVAMDGTYRTNVPVASVIVLSDENVSVATHAANVRDRSVSPAEYLTVDIKDGTQSGDTIFSSRGDLYTPGDEDYTKRLLCITDAVRRMAEIGSVYDPLHQTGENRYPAAPQGQEHLYPYAGMPYSAKRNFLALYAIDGEMMHPAVQEAAQGLTDC